MGSSYGYRNDGRVYSGKAAAIIELEKYGIGDVIGCGINYHRREIFFTKNGRFLRTVYTNIEIRDFYATIGLHYPDEEVTFNFG